MWEFDMKREQSIEWGVHLYVWILQVLTQVAKHNLASLSMLAVRILITNTNKNRNSAWGQTIKKAPVHADKWRNHFQIELEKKKRNSSWSSVANRLSIIHMFLKTTTSRENIAPIHHFHCRVQSVGL